LSELGTHGYAAIDEEVIPMRERKQEIRQRVSTYLEVSRACFREAEIASAWRTAQVFRRLGQQYLDKAKRLQPNIFAMPPAQARVPWRLGPMVAASGLRADPGLQADRSAG
jgi:hypothetical protein